MQSLPLFPFLTPIFNLFALTVPVFLSPNSSPLSPYPNLPFQASSFSRFSTVPIFSVWFLPPCFAIKWFPSPDCQATSKGGTDRTRKASLFWYSSGIGKQEQILDKVCLASTALGWGMSNINKAFHEFSWQFLTSLCWTHRNLMFFKG